MASANITALTALTTPTPTMLLYAGLSPFGVTDDRKITQRDLLSLLQATGGATGMQIIEPTAVHSPTVVGSPALLTLSTLNENTFWSLAFTNDATVKSINSFLDNSGNLNISLYSTNTKTGAILIGPPAVAGAAIDLFTVTTGHSTWSTTDTSTTFGNVANLPLAFLINNIEQGRFSGGGIFELGVTSSLTGSLALANSASAFLTTIQAGNAAAARTYVWPTNFGSAGDVLTDAAGNGVLSWAAGGGGGGTAPQVRAFNNANQSINSVAGTFLNFNSERFDTDAMHFTSSANLTGTVTKTATSATLAGAGTLFLTELSVGQVIAVPGTATEQRVVTAIASDTSLTVAVAFANTAAAQVGVRINGALVARTAGTYQISASVEWEANGTNGRLILVSLNPLTTAAFAGTFLVSEGGPSTSGFTMRQNISTLYQLAQWDYVELIAYQDSGGALNVISNGNNSPEFMMIKVSDS